jgi:dihydroxyacetone kinase
MTTLGTSTTFKRDWVDGFVTAYGRSVRKVPDAYGVVRRDPPKDGKVAVVIGGGCGHYPAFAGLVGPGLADGAVVGDVFTSPSAEQVYRTAKEADRGAGVLFGYGNYQGDVLHFGLAARRLAAEGIESRTVLVTDDVASGPAERPEQRRGVAGDFWVFKIAGAAAERGDDLAGVHAAAEKANAHIRTFGVAFGGCTLPGADEPLFSVADDDMELGLGIHGEPGVRTVGRLDASSLADELVDGLLPELPRGDGRIVVLLNGLGRTKYEEMFVAYTRVHERLASAGFSVLDTEVGEFVTSLDMAGMSLSVMVLDDELAELYAAPCDTPGYRRGGALLGPVTAESTVDEALASPEGAATNGVVDRVLTAGMRAIEAAEAELGRLDAVAADGDHGLGMTRGMRAAVCAVRAAEQPDVPEALLVSGTAFADAAGGASGALYGVLLAETGAGLRRCRELGGCGDEFTAFALADAVDAAVREFVQLSGAEVGEKTMLDAIEPFRIALREQAEAGAQIADGWRKAAQRASAAADDTAHLRPAKGRAARLAQRSTGHADPGATSFALLVTAIGEELSKEDD